MWHHNDVLRAIADRLIALIALAWWDRDHARLRATGDDFCRLEAKAFPDKYGG